MSSWEWKQNVQNSLDDRSITIVPLEIKGLKKLYVELISRSIESSRSECEKLNEFLAGSIEDFAGSIDINQF